MYNINDTICAIATAQGGAIGIIRISGQDAITIVDSVFAPKGKRPLTECKPYSIVLGHIKDKDGIVIDEVLVSVFYAPHSYTGEDSIEISCHGSSYILQRVIELLIENGCRMAEPGEYTQRAFLNGKMDLSQAEAVADLIASKNESTHRIAMQQMRGGYSNRLMELREKLLQMTALLELELDFSEEDVEFADRQQLIALAQEIKSEITHLTNTFRIGNAIKSGIPVAIIGAPNVGKSTLLNALLRDDRAIVSDIQGTTRDIIEDTININGITFRFIDTAGIRHTDDAIEQMGIERSVRASEKAQIIILLTEPGIPYPDIPTRPDQTIICIVNKTPEFQALHGIGISQLEAQLVATVPNRDDRDLLVSNIRHYEALTHALAGITHAIDSLKINLSGDLVSEDLRQCTYHLSEIVGEVTSSDTLQVVFERFCIGK